MTTALERYNLLTDNDSSPDSNLEKLRFFCSLAMNGQDWLDSEDFFDKLENEINFLKGALCENDPDLESILNRMARE